MTEWLLRSQLVLAWRKAVGRFGGTANQSKKDIGDLLNQISLKNNEFAISNS
jgi:hypothetical protein